MAYCTQCRHELRLSDKFCAECGTPVGGQTPHKLWEYCEITWTKAGWLSGACYFWGKGLGPTGVSEVVKGSRKFAVGSTILGPDPSREDKKTVAACDELVQMLVSSGWEPLPEKGPDWWSYKFRRPAGR